MLIFYITTNPPKNFNIIKKSENNENSIRLLNLIKIASIYTNIKDNYTQLVWLTTNL